MYIGILQIQLLIPGSHSLKEKRGVVRSLKDRAKHRFNLAIAEVGELDHWQIAMIAAVTVGSDRKYCEGVLRKFLDLVEDYREAEVGDYEIEVISGEAY